MQKILIILIFTRSLSVSCKESTINVSATTSKSDTILLKEKEVVFISPSEKNIQILKKKKGDDFYIIADDANNYFSEATNYLDSLKVSYKNYDDDKIIGYEVNNKFIEIPKYQNPWYAIFYQNQKFKTLDLVNVQNEYSIFFNKKELSNPSNLNPQKIIDSIAGNKYFVVEEKTHNLNNDTFMDKIIVLGNREDVNPQNPDTKIAPIIILLNQQDRSYKILKNEFIYPNDYGDAFKRLVIKNNFFTIELSNEVPDKYVSEKYVTFRYNEKSKEIVLSKYGENINWNDGRKNNILCSEKNFGKILFQDYNSNNVNGKCPK